MSDLTGEFAWYRDVSRSSLSFGMTKCCHLSTIYTPYASQRYPNVDIALIKSELSRKIVPSMIEP